MDDTKRRAARLGLKNNIFRLVRVTGKQVNKPIKGK
jgi:hypothetical protein